MYDLSSMLNMQLNEEIQYYPSASSGKSTITRVPGGWIYKYTCTDGKGWENVVTMCFVPIPPLDVF